MSKMGRVLRKSVFGVPDKVRHKQGCTATEDGSRHEISDLGRRGIVLHVPEILSSENKGADQLPGNRTANHRLCFCIFKKQVFL